MIRILDILLSLLGLLLFTPLFLLGIAPLMLLTQGFPIFFSQVRTGQHFKPFTLYKLRTMKIASEDKKGLTQGLSDKRITKIGLFLRNYKIDELPQFYNVLKGDMSFVGSRPQVPYYTKKFEYLYQKILVYKPGLFSPAATTYLNEASLLDVADDPIQYYENVLIPIKCKLDIELVKNYTFKKYISVLFTSIQSLLGLKKG